eukprot:5884084-Pyramimonas_sp.AAC.1
MALHDQGSASEGQHGAMLGLRAGRGRLRSQIAEDRVARFTGRLKFGKLDQVNKQGIDYMGMRIRRMHGRALIVQGKYIDEDLRKVGPPRGRRSNLFKTLPCGRGA